VPILRNYSDRSAETLVGRAQIQKHAPLHLKMPKLSEKDAAPRGVDSGVGKKRKHKEMETAASSAGDDASDSGSVASVPYHSSAKPTRGVKTWRADNAGAEMGPDGGYIHHWNEEYEDGGRDKFQVGPWTPEEDALLLDAFDKFCDDHGLEGPERSQLVVEKITDSEHRRAWLHCAKMFRHRSVRAVHRRAIRLLHPGNFRGAWSEEEQKELLRLADEKNRSWLEISKVLNRLPASCRNLYDRIKGAFATAWWSAAEEEALLAAVKEYGERQDNGGYTNIPWGPVADAVGSRSMNQCIGKWTGGYGERALGLKWSDELDLKLAHAIVADGGETRDEVFWPSLLPGRLSADCKRRFDLLSKRIPRATYLPFVELVDALADDLDAAAEAAATAGGSGKGSGRKPTALVARDATESAGASAADGKDGKEGKEGKEGKRKKHKKEKKEKKERKEKSEKRERKLAKEAKRAAAKAEAKLRKHAEAAAASPADSGSSSEEEEKTAGAGRAHKGARASSSTAAAHGSAAPAAKSGAKPSKAPVVDAADADAAAPPKAKRSRKHHDADGDGDADGRVESGSSRGHAPEAGAVSAEAGKGSSKRDKADGHRKAEKAEKREKKHKRERRGSAGAEE